MNLTESLKGSSARATGWWDKAPQGQRFALIGGAAAVVVAVVITLVLAGSSKEWEPAILYADLEYKEAAEITRRLSALSIPYRLTEDAGSILVPRDQVRDLRLQMAGEGFPKSGRIGYEIFDKNQLSMTDFLQKVNLRRALQGELEKTVMGIQGIRNVRIHLVSPEPSLFVEEQKPVTASVTVTLAPGARLEPRQIEAIANLVSASVEGLAVDNVVIVDAQGVLLSEEKDPLAKVANKQFQLQQQVERALEKKVQTMLDEVIGAGHSKVRLNVTLNFEQKNVQQELVDPGASQVIISEETTEKTSADQGSEETAVRNYEVNRTIQNIIGSVGTVDRLSLALTIDKTRMVFNEATKEYTEEQRSQEEIDQLAALAKEAIGFAVSRGDQIAVFAMPFDKTQEMKSRHEQEVEEKKQFWTHIAINVAKVLGILAALIALRFIIQAIGRGVGVEQKPEELGELDTVVQEEEFERPETPHDIVRNRLQQMVREHPEDSAKLIRTMLAEA